MKKISEFKWTSKYKMIAAGALAAVAVILIAVIFAVTGGDAKESGSSSEQGNSSVNEESMVTATPAGEEKLQKNAVEQVNTLVNSYFTACKEGKIEELQKLVSNGEDLTKEQVQKPYEYVEKIQNVDCYTLNGPDAGTYIVYVYYELKFVNVDTVAPGLMQLYVSPTSDDSLVIMLDELDSHVEEARKAALEREDVKSLIATVNAKFTEAANKDANLKALITKMNAQEQLAAPAETPAATAAAGAATKAPEATKAPAATKAAQ